MYFTYRYECKFIRSFYSFFLQIWIELGTRDVHKDSLYDSEFRENWISENHILLKGYKFNCLPAIFIFRFE